MAGVRRGVAAAEDAASALAFAARVGDLGEVHRLLGARVDPNARDAVGETPLFEAAASGNVSVVATLVLAGADPDLQSLMGTSAVGAAANESVRALLKVSCGDEVDADAKRAILGELHDDELRQQVKLFMQSLSGENDEEPDLDADDSGEDFHVSGNPELDPEDDDTWDLPALPLKPFLLAPRKSVPPKPAVEVEMVVNHAIQEGQIKLRLMSDVTFLDVKQAILQRLARAGQPVQNLYLVHKERDAYQAYKDKDPIGDVRHVRMVGACLPPPEEGDL